MSIVLANLGRHDAGYEQGEGDEAPSEPAQSDPQGTPGCANVKSGNADGAVKAGKGKTKVGSKGPAKSAVKASRPKKR